MKDVDQLELLALGSHEFNLLMKISYDFRRVHWNSRTMVVECWLIGFKTAGAIDLCPEVEEIEREIEQMRVSRGATLEGQDQADSSLECEGRAHCCAGAPPVFCLF